MALHMELSTTVLACLAKDGVSPAEILIVTDSDLDRAGQYSRIWLAVTDQALYEIKEEEDAASLLQRLPLAEITGIRVDSRVGTGILEASLGERVQEVVQFTNLHAQKFARIAAKLNRRLKGFPIVITPEDDRDERKCPTCRCWS